MILPESLEQFLEVRHAGAAPGPCGGSGGDFMDAGEAAREDKARQVLGGQAEAGAEFFRGRHGGEKVWPSIHNFFRTRQAPISREIPKT